MSHPRDSERAVSDVFGAVILIGVVVTVFALAGVMMFSQPQPQKIPALNAIISSNAQTIAIQHQGGDSFNYQDVHILVDGKDLTSSFKQGGSTGWSNWAVGQSLTYDIPAGQQAPSSVLIVYNAGGVSHLIAQKGEGGAGGMGGLPIPAPGVTGITPNSGAAGDVVPITNLAGSDFFNGASVKLRRAGSSDITASNVIVVSPTKITCDFALAGITPGGVAWDVVVTNPGGPSGTLTKGFTIVPGLPPVADFSGMPLSGTIPLTVAFTDLSTRFPDSWLWTFGDGNTSFSQNPTNTYSTPGTYNVSLAATNTAGTGNLVKTGYITVNPVVIYTINATATPPGGSISPSGAVSVVMGNNQNFTISADTGYHIANVLVDSVSQGAISSYPFTNVVANHTITATFAINQYTITATSGANGNVTPAGVTPVLYGGSQAYNITPVSGYHVADVLVNNATVGAVTTYEFTNVNANQTISATFAINQFTITPSVAGGNGAISPDTVQTVDYRATPTFNFTPAIAYHLHNVTVNSVQVTPTGNNSYTFPPVTENKTIVARFMIDPPVAGFTGSPRTGPIPLSVSFNDTSTNNPASWLWNFGDFHYAYVQHPINTYSDPQGGNYSVQLTAANAGGSNSSLKNGYIFTYKPVVANFTGSPTSGPKSLTVWFTDSSTGDPSSWYWQFGDTDTVNTSTAQNPGHTYSKAGLYSVNLTVTNTFSQSSLVRTAYINVTNPPPVAHILANKTSGYSPLPVSFLDLSSNSPTSWLWHFDDGTPDVTTLDAIHTFTSPGIYNVSLTATNAYGSSTAYQLITATGFSITASSGANGNVTPYGVTPVNEGGNQAYAIAPSTGYHVGNVLIDGVSNGTISSYTFWNVQADHTISATFAINTYTITATAGANGAIIPNGTATVNYGATPTYTMQPSKTYHVADVLVNGTSVGTGKTYVFPPVYTNKTIAVSFAKNPSQQIYYQPFTTGTGWPYDSWTRSNNAVVLSTTVRNGSSGYSVRDQRTYYFGRIIPTTGYDEIIVRYAWRNVGLAAAEYSQAQYTINGAAYTSFQQITGPTASLAIVTYSSLPSTTWENANFGLRFQVYGNANSDYLYVDDVQVFGTPI
jgi:PKD repeat protein